MPSVTLRALLAVLLVVSFAAAGCDTTDPVPPADPADVAGIYDIVTFRFTPNAQAIAPANVLDDLVSEATFVELLDTQRGGQFQIRFRRTGELADLINGDFDVSQNALDMVVREEDRASLPSLLLDPQIAFVRDDASTLVRNVTKVVNLERYDSEQYGDAGLTEVRGRLEIRLIRRSR